MSANNCRCCEKDIVEEEQVLSVESCSCILHRECFFELLSKQISEDGWSCPVCSKRPMRGYRYTSPTTKNVETITLSENVQQQAQKLQRTPDKPDPCLLLSHIDDLSTSVETTKDKSQQLKDMVTRLKNECYSLQGEVLRLTTELNNAAPPVNLPELENTINELREENKQLSEEISDAKEGENQLKMKLEKALAQRELLKYEVSKVKEELKLKTPSKMVNELTCTIGSLAAQMEDLTAKSEQDNKDLKNLKDKLATLASDRDNVQNEVNKLQKLLGERESELTVARAENSNLTTTRNFMDSQLKEKDGTIVELTNVRSGLEKEISELRAEKENLVATTNNLKSQISERDEKINKLSSQREEIAIEVTFLKSENENLVLTTSDLKSQISEFEQKVQSLMNSMEEMKYVSVNDAESVNNDEEHGKLPPIPVSAEKEENPITEALNTELYDENEKLRSKLNELETYVKDQQSELENLRITKYQQENREREVKSEAIGWLERINSKIDWNLLEDKKEVCVKTFSDIVEELKTEYYDHDELTTAEAKGYCVIS